MALLTLYFKNYIYAQATAVNYGVLLVAMLSDGTYAPNALEAVDTTIQTKACEPNAPNSMATHTYGA